MTRTMLLLMAVYIGLEPDEAETEDGLKTQLEENLGQYNLTIDEFGTEATMFALGYHRGLTSRPYDQADMAGDNASLASAIEAGFGFGLEARGLPTPPPPSLVHEAWKSGAVVWGGLQAWASTLDLSTSHRLSVALAVGSGKTGTTIPAGTPVDVLDASIEKDGVNHAVVVYDGVALLVPNPDDAPRLVPGDTVVNSAPTKTRAKRASGKKTGERKAPADRGPSLRDIILAVFEGEDGGPGPLATDVEIGQRVSMLARERGIGDKANTFLQKSDRHVPYYLGIYRPKDNGEVNRYNVENPLAWVVKAIMHRRDFLNNQLSDKDKAEIASLRESGERMTLLPRSDKPKADDKADGGDKADKVEAKSDDKPASEKKGKKGKAAQATAEA